MQKKKKSSKFTDCARQICFFETGVFTSMTWVVEYPYGYKVLMIFEIKEFRADKNWLNFLKNKVVQKMKLSFINTKPFKKTQFNF